MTIEHASIMNKTTDTLRRLKAKDDARPGFPGEHWLVLGAGLLAWRAASRHRSPIVRAVGTLAATALVGRAASGRDGLAKVLRLLPIGRGIR
ncbi:MAG TPA: hypothetical protein VGE20_00130 [Ramlibacter sp.]